MTVGSRCNLSLGRDGSVNFFLSPSFLIIITLKRRQEKKMGPSSWISESGLQPPLNLELLLQLHSFERDILHSWRRRRIRWPRAIAFVNWLASLSCPLVPTRLLKEWRRDLRPHQQQKGRPRVKWREETRWVKEWNNEYQDFQSHSISRSRNFRFFLEKYPSFSFLPQFFDCLISLRTQSWLLFL
jgi:hypothetical protein